MSKARNVESGAQPSPSAFAFPGKYTGWATSGRLGEFLVVKVETYMSDGHFQFSSWHHQVSQGYTSINPQTT